MTTTRTRFRAAVATATVAALALFTACASGDDTPANSAGELATDDPLPTEVPDGTAIVVADDANRLATLFRLSGEQDTLTAEVTYANFSSGPLRLEAIRSGHAQLGSVGDVPPILAHYSDANVPIVGARQRSGPGSLIATAPNSGIETLEDLAGAQVGINEGTAQQAILLRNLDAVGLSSDDVEVVNLELSEFADGLRTDQIDAAVLKEPDRSRYLESVQGTEATELPNADGANPNLSYVYASRDALGDPAQAAAVREFIVAWHRAEEWRNQNPDVWLEEYLIGDQQVDRADAEQIIASEGTTAAAGFTDELVDTQQTTIDLLQDAGAFAGKELDAADEFDPRFGDLGEES